MANNNDISKMMKEFDKEEAISNQAAEDEKRVEDMNSLMASFDTGITPNQYAVDGHSDYDQGYTPLMGDMNEFRATNQGVGDEIGNRLGMMVPSMAMGIGELAGYVLDAPDNIYGLVSGGESMFSEEKNTFSNWFSDTMKEYSTAWSEDNPWFKNYRKNPDQVIDMSDSAFWVDNGFDGAESILEFLITGFGVGKAAGLASKGLAGVGRAAFAGDMLGSTLGAINKTATKAGQVMNTMLTGESVAALNAAQTYKDIYEEAKKTKKSDGSFYTDDEVSAIAARNAASTFGATLVTGTLLNITSLAPILGKTSNLKNLSPKVKTHDSFINYIDEAIAKTKGTIKGGKTSAYSWVKKKANPSSLVGEMFQEGIEEVTENISSDAGKMSARNEMGSYGDINIMSEENGLAFAAGAFGGGIGKGFGSAFKRLAGKDNSDAEYINFLEAQKKALVKQKEVFDDIRVLDSMDLEAMSEEEYDNNRADVAYKHSELIANALTTGLDNGTYRIMVQELENVAKEEAPDGADPEDVERNKAKANSLLKIIKKHKAMKNGFTESKNDRAIQMMAMRESIILDVNNISIDEQNSKIDEISAIYRGEASLAKKFNRRKALLANKSNLSPALKEELSLLNAEFKELGAPLRSLSKSFENSDMKSAYSKSIKLEIANQEKAENINKLSSESTAEAHSKEMAEKEAKDLNNHITTKLAAELANNIESTISSSTNANDIDEQISELEALSKDKSLPANLKKQVKAIIKKAKAKAVSRKKSINEMNSLSDSLSNLTGDAALVYEIVRGRFNGIPITENEDAFLKENRKLVKTIEANMLAVNEFFMDPKLFEQGKANLKSPVSPEGDGDQDVEGPEDGDLPEDKELNVPGDRSDAGVDVDVETETETTSYGEAADAFADVIDGAVYPLIKDPASEYPDSSERANELGLISESEHDIDGIEKILKSLDVNKATMAVFKLVKGIASTLGVGVEFSSNYDKNPRLKISKGYFDPATSSIVVDINSLGEGDSKFAVTIVHEIIHAVTTFATETVLLDKANDVKFLNKDQIAAVKNLNAILDDLRSDPDFKGQYGVKNIHELLAELANPEFVDKLKAKEYDENSSIWDKIVQFIGAIFGKRTTAHALVTKQLEVIITDPSIDSLSHYADPSDSPSNATIFALDKESQQKIDAIEGDRKADLQGGVVSVEDIKKILINNDTLSLPVGIVDDEESILNTLWNLIGINSTDSIGRKGLGKIAKGAYTADNIKKAFASLFNGDESLLENIFDKLDHAMNNGDQLSSGQEEIDEINAKYDAKLEALSKKSKSSGTKVKKTSKQISVDKETQRKIDAVDAEMQAKLIELVKKFPILELSRGLEQELFHLQGEHILATQAGAEKEYISKIAESITKTKERLEAVKEAGKIVGVHSGEVSGKNSKSPAGQKLTTETLSTPGGNVSIEHKESNLKRGNTPSKYTQMEDNNELIDPSSEINTHSKEVQVKIFRKKVGGSYVAIRGNSPEAKQARAKDASDFRINLIKNLKVLKASLEKLPLEPRTDKEILARETLENKIAPMIISINDIEKQLDKYYKDNTHNVVIKNYEVSGTGAQRTFRPAKNFETTDVVTSKDTIPEEDRHYVNEIYETVADGEVLISNTPVLAIGSKVVIEVDENWEYFPNAEDKGKPVLVYRVDKQGNKSKKPIKRLIRSESDALTNAVIDSLQSGKETSIKAVVSGKGQGELNLEYDKNGDRAKHPLSSLVFTEGLPLTLGIVDMHGAFKIPNREYSNFSKPIWKKLLAFESSNQVGTPGASFALITNPKGDIVPVYISGSKLSESMIDQLSGVGLQVDENSEQRGAQNIGEILAGGLDADHATSPQGRRDLKKLIPVKAAGSDIDIRLKEAEKAGLPFVATSYDLFFQSDAISEAFPSVPKGSWIAMNYNAFGDGYKGPKNPLDNFLKGEPGSMYKVYVKNEDGGVTNYTKKTTSDGRNNYFPADGIADLLDSDLRTALANSRYNISEDYANLNYSEESSEDGSTSYNDTLSREGRFTTNLTTKKDKFFQTPVKLQFEQESDNPINEYREVVKKRTTAVVNDAKKDSESAEEVEEFDEDNFELFRMNDTGGDAMSSTELDWLLENLGEGNVEVKRAVKRVTSIGGKEALGYYSNALVTIAENAEEGTAYHEAFHFIFHVAMNDGQRKNVLRKAKQRFGDKSDIALEEDLAEEFRAYKLGTMEVEPKGIIKRFYEWLMSQLQFNRATPIESLYRQMSNGNGDSLNRGWKNVYKGQIGENVDSSIVRNRLVGKKFGYTDQEHMISNLASEAIFIASQKVDKSSAGRQTFRDILSTKKGLNTVIDEVKEKITKYRDESAEIAKELKENPREDKQYRKDLNLANQKHKLLNEVISHWDLTEEEKSSLNPPATFREELIKGMAKYGFQVSVSENIEGDSTVKELNTEEFGSLKLESTLSEGKPGEGLYEEAEDDSVEHVHGKDISLKSTKVDLNPNVKMELSLLPQYEIVDGKIKYENGEPVTKKNFFGNPVYFEFNTIYSSIKSLLSNIPLEDLMDEIRVEAGYTRDNVKQASAPSNPVIEAVYLLLNKKKAADATTVDGFTAAFLSSFHNASVEPVTIKSGMIGRDGKPEIILVNRNSIISVMEEKWAASAARSSNGLVDINGVATGSTAESKEAIRKKWESIKRNIEKNYNDFSEKKRLGLEYEADAAQFIEDTLKTMGFEVSVGAGQRAGLIAGDLLTAIGGSKASTLLKIATRGVNQKDKMFSSNSNMLNTFTKAQAKFEHDIVSGSAFVNGKQIHSINMTSFVTDFVNKLKSQQKHFDENPDDTEAPDLLGMYLQDKFRNPGGDAHPEMMNMFLEMLMDPANIDALKIIHFFDFKESKVGVEYDQTSYNQSLAQKVIGSQGAGKNMGYFSFGTLSDKLKSLGLKLPISGTTGEAKLKAAEAMKRTIFQELVRIGQVTASDKYAKTFPGYGTKDFIANQFQYFPELEAKVVETIGDREITVADKLRETVSNSDISIDSFNEIFEQYIPDMIKAKIDEAASSQMEKLVKKGVLTKMDNGLFSASEEMAKHLGTNNTERAALIIEKHFIEDGMWRMELSKVLMDDYAKYKGFWDYNKRMYQIVTPGRVAFVGVDEGIKNASQKKTMNRVIIRSPRSTFSETRMVADAIGILTKSFPVDLNVDELTSTLEKAFAAIVEKEKKSSNKGEVKPVGNEVVRKITDQIVKNATNKEFGRKVKNAIEVAYNYRSNNKADSATIISIAFYRDQLMGQGLWSPEKEWVYNNVWNGVDPKDGTRGVTIEQAVASLSDEDKKYYTKVNKKMTADALKPFFYGPRLETITDGDVEITHTVNEQFKDSMMPVLPIWGKTISGFSWALGQFERNGVDAITTDDAVKQGKSNVINLGDADDVVKDNMKTGIDTSFLRYPQVSAKPKNSVISSSQYLKNIYSNLKDEKNHGKYKVGNKRAGSKELLNNMELTFEQKIINSYNEVVDKLNIPRDISVEAIFSANTGNRFQLSEKQLKELPKIRLKALYKLRSMVSESVIDSNKSEDLIDALDIITSGSNGQYEYEIGMGFEPYSRAYQNILQSLVKSNILRQEVYGHSMVNTGDLAIETDDHLAFVSYDPVTGETIPAEISMPFSYGEYIGIGHGKLNADGNPTVDEKGNILEENLTAEQKEAIKIILYRVPNQMKSSSIPAKVKRIMPESQGAMVMLPGEMTTQAGLDFDFDKSFSAMKRVVKYKDTQADLDRDAKKIADKKPVKERVYPTEGEQDPSKMNKTQIDNHLFDLQWAILTDGYHYEELITPVSSRTHDDLLSEMPELNDAGIDTNNPFGTLSNVEMESLFKYSHTMRGTFSKFLSAHNTLNALRTMVDDDIDNIVVPRDPIRIASGVDNYKYDSFGRERDSNDKLIGENISEDLNSALDAGADPKLGKLNTSVFNSQVNGYMAMLGVPPDVIKLYMVTPIMRQLSDEFFALGGIPSMLDKAIKNVLERNSISTLYENMEKKNDKGYISPKSLGPDSFSDTLNARILLNYKRMSRAASQMTAINDTISPETQKKSDAAGLYEFLEKQNRATVATKTNPIIAHNLLSIGGKYMRRVKAFTEKGIRFGVSLAKSFTPHFSPFYSGMISSVRELQGNGVSMNWGNLDKILTNTGLIAMQRQADIEGLDVIDMISPGFRDRISIYKMPESVKNSESNTMETIIDSYDYIMDQFPALSKNQFLISLTKDFSNRKNMTQRFKFPTSAEGSDLIALKGGLAALLKHKEPDVKEFGHDLIAYMIQTTGFAKSSNSFIGMIPNSFWIKSGISELSKRSARNSEFSGGDLSNDENALSKVLLKTIGAGSSIVPSFDQKDVKGSKGNSQISITSILNMVRSGETAPSIVKVFDAKTKRFNLYEISGSYDPSNREFNPASLVYFPTQTLGEPGISNEYFSASSYIPGEKSGYQKALDAIREDELAQLEDLAEDITVDDQSSPNEIDDNFSPQLVGSETNETLDNEIEAQLDAFLKANGISVEIIESMKKRFGVDATGIADAFNKIIYLSRGEGGRLAKPEEVAHILIESTLGSRQTQAMLDAVEGTEEYAEVQRLYGKLYKGDTDRMKREAAAKILAKVLTDPESIPAKTTLGRIIQKFMNAIKRKFGKMAPFHMASQDILNAVVLNKPTQAVNDQYMFSSEDDGDWESDADDMSSSDAAYEAYLESLTPEQREAELRGDNLEMTAEENAAYNEAMIADAHAENKILEELELADFTSMTEEEKDEYIRINNETSISSLKDLIANIKFSLKSKAARLTKQDPKGKQLKDLKVLYAQLDEMQDAEAVVTYLESANDRIRELTKEFKVLRDAGTLTPDYLVEVQSEVDSYLNIEFIAKFLETNDVDEVLSRDLLDMIANIDGAATTLNRKLSVHRVAVIAPILAEMTSEDLSISEIEHDLTNANKDVSFLSKWLRPGMDSSDLLVRLTQKVINDAKQEAMLSYLDLYRGKDGAENVNREYEEWAKSEGIDISDMAERNKMFLTTEKVKKPKKGEAKERVYIVNNVQGKEKYRKILALPKSHPARRYYDTFVWMHMNSQSEAANGGYKTFGYELPRIRKSNYEMLLGSRKSSLLEVGKENLRDLFTTRDEDDEDGFISTEKYDRDENNNEIKGVPIYYTNRKIEASEVSMDMAFVIQAAAFNQIQFSKLNKMKGLLYSMEQIALNRRVSESDDKNRGFLEGPEKLLNSFGGTVSKPGAKDNHGESSNSRHQIQMILDQHLHGQSKGKNPTYNILGFKVKLGKIGDALKRITSMKIMSFNFNIAFSNGLTAEAMMIQEAVSGRFFNMDDWKTGLKIVKDEYGSMVADSFSRKKHSKMGSILEFMNLSNNAETVFKRLGQQGSTKGKAIEAFQKSANLMQEFSEIGVMAQSVGATMSNMKVKDTQGNEKTVYEVLEIVDGKMVVPDGYTYKGKPLADQMNAIRERVIYVHESMHGIYNRTDAPAFSATLLGQQMMFMRGWLFSQMSSRFDGLEFRERVGDYNEGTLVSMAKLIKNVTSKNGPMGTMARLNGIIGLGEDTDMLLSEKEKEKFKNNPEQLNRLIKMRRAGMKKSMAEISMFLALTILTTLAFGDDEEELDADGVPKRKKAKDHGIAYTFARYHSLRLEREISFYNPKDLFEIFKNPSITTTTITDMLSLVTIALNPFSWNDKVSSGKYRGNNKALHIVARNVPLINQFRTWDNLNRKADAIEQGYR